MTIPTYLKNKQRRKVLNYYGIAGSLSSAYKNIHGQVVSRFHGLTRPEISKFEKSTIDFVERYDFPLLDTSYVNNDFTTSDNLLEAETYKDNSKKEENYLDWKRKRIKLIQLEIFNNNFQKIKPGKITLYDKNLLIGTGSCPLRIISLQLEGKKISKSLDFIKGYKEILNETLPS